MRNLVPAVQIFTLRQFTQTPEGLEMCFRRIKQMGCDTVQISRIGETIPADFVTSLCKEYDMKICVTHSPLERIFNDLPKLIQEHKDWGCDSIGLGNLNHQYLDDGYEGYCRFLKDMEPVIKELKANDMKFAYHSHTYEFVKYKGRLMYDMLIEETDPYTFNFIQDSFWMRYGGINHIDYIRKVSGRMKVLHVKDYTTRLDFFSNVEGIFGTMGEGNIDYPPILDACEKAGVKYLAIEQDICLRDPFDCLNDALIELRRLISAN